MTREERLEAARTAQGEAVDLDFKERFDPDSARDWCEVMKDLVAMANSGGGCVLFGVRNDGSPSGRDVGPLIALDPAKVTGKISRYTGLQFAGFGIFPLERGGQRVAALVVDEAVVPIVFSNPGTYAVEGNRQETAFGRGTVYFRHGAKSEPGRTDDLRAFIDRRLREERGSLLSNVRRVFEAPVGQPVVVVPIDAAAKVGAASTPVRWTSDPAAPVFRPGNPDDTHPHRQKEVVASTNARLVGRATLSGHDIQCVRKVHGIDASKPEFFQQRRFESARYSDQFIEWLVAHFEADPEFFAKARAAAKQVS